MRQVGLIPSGCNTKDGLEGLGVLHSNSKYLFYASTLAVYVLNQKTFVIEKILSAADKPICYLAVSQHDDNLLATVSLDGMVTVWDYESQEILWSLNNACSSAGIIDFDPHNKGNTLIVQCTDVKVFTWQVGGEKFNTCFQVTGAAKASCAHWNPRKEFRR